MIGGLQLKSCDSGEFRLRVQNWISTSVLEIPWILRVAAFLLSYQKRFIWRYLHPRLMGVGGPHLAQDPGFKHQFVFFNDMFHVILLGFEKSVCLLTLVQEFGVLKSIFSRTTNSYPKNWSTKIESHQQFILCTVDASEIPRPITWDVLETL